jgi:hypothetical protein
MYIQKRIREKGTEYAGGGGVMHNATPAVINISAPEPHKNRFKT